MITEINLKDVRFFARHGVYPIEQEQGNTFIVNITLRGDFTRAVESDDLEDTISYAEVYEVIEEVMNVPSKLLEHVAGRIHQSVMAAFPQIISLRVEISKTAPIGCGGTAFSSFVLDK